MSFGEGRRYNMFTILILANLSHFNYTIKEFVINTCRDHTVLSCFEFKISEIF